MVPEVAFYLAGPANNNSPLTSSPIEIIQLLSQMDHLNINRQPDVFRSYFLHSYFRIFNDLLKHAFGVDHNLVLDDLWIDLGEFGVVNQQQQDVCFLENVF